MDKLTNKVANLQIHFRTTSLGLLLTLNNSEKTILNYTRLLIILKSALYVIYLSLIFNAT